MPALSLCSLCGSPLPGEGLSCPGCSTAPQVKVADPGIASHAPKPPVDRMIGTTVGNYKIESPLGAGGMGAVYRAYHPGLDRHAAVKVLRTELSSDPKVLERFFNEARAANQIGHPGIVDIFDLGSLPNGRCYMVMELLEGEDLERYHERRGALGDGEARAIGLRILDTLAAAHERGIIHRDLKPANIFLSKKRGKSSLKLLDFGVAKLMGSNGLGGTQSGAFLGTPRYMAPEQARSASSIDARADLYSLGVILYELLTGHPIFPGETSVSMIHAHQFETPVPPRKLRPELSPELEAVILCALSKEPAGRYATATEMAIALRQSAGALLDEQGDGPSTLVDDSPFGAQGRANTELLLEERLGNTLELVSPAGPLEAVSAPGEATAPDSGPGVLVIPPTVVAPVPRPPEAPGPVAVPAAPQPAPPAAGPEKEPANALSQDMISTVPEEDAAALLRDTHEDAALAGERLRETIPLGLRADPRPPAPRHRAGVILLVVALLGAAALLYLLVSGSLHDLLSVDSVRDARP